MRVFIFILFCPLFCFAQKHDYVWMFGFNFDHDVPEDSLSGISIIDFNESPPRIYYDGYKKMDFTGSGMCMSDAEGNFLFSSNGEWIENHANQSMQNDNILNFFEPTSTHQASMALPLKGNPSRYVFLHTTRDFFPDISGSKDLHYSIIDMEENNGKGKVIELNNIVFSDTLDRGKLIATKHANGEDWWIVLRKLNSNKHFIIFFDGENFELKEQEIGTPTFKGFGHACFSPDGSKYVNTTSLNEVDGRYFDLYDFDRCSGELSNHVQVHAESPGISGGAAFSPNSRFLYMGSYDKIFQYDTWVNDIVESETVVAEYDNHFDTLFNTRGDTFFVATRFLFMQLAPDGKIYINTPGSTKTLHTIESPDEKGIDCNVKQHSVKLPTPNITMISFPNYRLGALQGSPCDTLTSSSIQALSDLKISLYPNPTTGKIRIDFERPIGSEGQLNLYNLTGKHVKTFPIFPQQKDLNLNLGAFPTGLYFYKIETEEIIIETGKLVITNR